MARRLRVQHWVACLEADVEPPAGVNNFYNLLQAGYVLTAPADAEFPWPLPRLDMFARFVGGVGTAEFEDLDDDPFADDSADADEDRYRDWDAELPPDVDEDWDDR